MDIRLYFREDDKGYRWATVAFLDRTNNHQIIDHMPLVGDGVVPWFFGEIAQRGFPLARETKLPGAPDEATDHLPE